jgi:hypothetical protein
VEVERWEYHHELWDGTQLLDFGPWLNALGAEGWELMSMQVRPGECWYRNCVFKRRARS